MIIAADGDTWGIPGPAFLVLYVIALLAVTLLATVHRRFLFAGNRDAQVDSLGPQQVAYLNGGDRLAVYASLGGLRSAGAIGAGSFKTLQQTGPMPGGVTPLDTAVYNAAGRRVTSRALFTDEWVRSALDQLRDGLEAQGLVVGAASLKAARLWAYAALAVLLLGIARLIDGLQNDRPVTFLVFALIAALLITIRLWRQRSGATRSARKGLTALRRRHDYLAPKQSPSYATYGATGAAMGVALYGGAALYTMDPAFAAEADIPRMTGGGGGDGGSSSSCGSSGSSCGGGGGCGGGGCGG